MNFDQWIDAVNTKVHAQLGSQVKTQELSWDAAHWVSPTGNVVASLDNTERAATLSFDNGERLSVAFQQPNGSPEIVGERIAQRLR